MVGRRNNKTNYVATRDPTKNLNKDQKTQEHEVLQTNLLREAEVRVAVVDLRGPEYREVPRLLLTQSPCGDLAGGVRTEGLCEEAPYQEVRVGEELHEGGIPRQLPFEDREVLCPALLQEGLDEPQEVQLVSDALQGLDLDELRGPHSACGVPATSKRKREL